VTTTDRAVKPHRPLHVGCPDHVLHAFDDHDVSIALA
jgi:hypothetical protein